MEDLFEDILEEENILKRYDDYSIYCYYLGYDPEFGKAYHSPLRDDDDIPSFSIFKVKDGTILFRDFATGKSGNVFKFVQEYFGYSSILDALSKINVDLDLQLTGGKKMPRNGIKQPKLVKQPAINPLEKIEVLTENSSEIYKYFSQYGISSKSMELYNARQVITLKLNYKKDYKLFYPKELTISYRVGLHYQIYSPNTRDKRKKRFINDLPANVVFGLNQLDKKQEFIIITKSVKEIMFFHSHFGWKSVAPKSETTMISRENMIKLLQVSKKIFIWFDYDKAGQEAQAKYLKEYPFLIPIYYRKKDKDPTDAYKNSNNKELILKEIKELIWQQKKK